MRSIYWLFAFLGVMTPTATFITGFKHDPAAPWENYGFNAALYLAYAAVHLVTTRPFWKKLLTGKPEGSPGERRIYITISIVTWIALFAFHRPMPGPSYSYQGWMADWIPLLGLCAVLLSVFALFEIADFQMLGGLLGVHGHGMSHSHGEETPLLMEGSYSSVRHPMYRAFILIGLTSIIIHPHLPQLFWAVFFGATFLIWVPVEEGQLIAARGDGYRAYMKQTPYRVFRGVW